MHKTLAATIVSLSALTSAHAMASGAPTETLQTQNAADAALLKRAQQCGGYIGIKQIKQDGEQVQQFGHSMPATDATGTEPAVPALICAVAYTLDEKHTELVGMTLVAQTEDKGNNFVTVATKNGGQWTAEYAESWHDGRQYDAKLQPDGTATILPAKGQNKRFDYTVKCLGESFGQNKQTQDCPAVTISLTPSTNGMTSRPQASSAAAPTTSQPQ